MQFAQHGFVFPRGLDRIRKIAADAVDVVHRNRHAREQRAARHAEVTVRMIGRHVTLIAPEHMDADPVDSVSPGMPRVREQSVQALRGAAARQAYISTAACRE